MPEGRPNTGQGTLFDVGEPSPPETQKEERNRDALLTLHARELLGLGDEYQWCLLRFLPDGPGPFHATEVGFRRRVPKKRGSGLKWVGKTVKAYVSHDSHAQWKRAWGERTGKCAACEGRGRYLRSWRAGEKTYRDCAACAGTGRGTE